MAGLSFTLDLDDAQMRVALARWAAGDGDLYDLMDPIGSALRDNVLDRFEHGRGPDGTAWKKSRRAAQQGGQTLVDKGRLRDSITYEATAREVEVGSNVIYAAIHQFGGVIKAKTAKGLAFTVPGFAAEGGGEHLVIVDSVTMPPRPFLPATGPGAALSPEDEDAIHDMVEAWIRAPLASLPAVAS